MVTDEPTNRGGSNEGPTPVKTVIQAWSLSYLILSMGMSNMPVTRKFVRDAGVDLHIE
jgi:hypothetical protein